FSALATLAIFTAARSASESRLEPRAPNPWWLFAGGFLLGLTALMRENILVAAPLFFLWAVWPRAGADERGAPTAGGGLRASLIAGAVLFAGTLLPILPATIRNAVVAKEFVLITSLGGENFYTGNNDVASGRYTPPPFVRPDPQYEHEDFRREAAKRAG